MEINKLNTTLHQKLVELSAGASGFSVSEVTGYTPTHVRNAAEALVRAGRIVRSSVGPRRVRYFADAKLSGAYRPTPTRGAASALTGGPRFKAGWSADEPALITARTKIVVAPPLPSNVFRTNTYAQM